MGEEQFREPTPHEDSLLKRLLEAEFPGREELAVLIRDVRVRTIDDYGSLDLQSYSDAVARVIKRVPVEAEAQDADGFIIHVLLHVIEGRPAELEIYKDDGSRIKRMPSASAFDLIVLPPAP